MKKTILALSLATAMFTTANAQEEEKSDEKVYTPQSGDIGISIDAAPFFNYAGDLLNFSGNQAANAPTFDSPFNNGGSIMGRYFLDDNTAIRGIFGVTMSNSVNRSHVDELDSEGAVVEDEDGEAQKVMNKVANRNTNVIFGGGLEKRRGYGRLQGFYGAQLTMGIMGSSTVNTYGNDIESEANSTGGTTGEYSRVLKQRNATMQFMLNLEAFIGAEYFFAPKMSVGGQFLWGPNFSWGGSDATIVTSEYYDFDEETSGESETEELNSGGMNNLRALALTAQGQLFLSFYF